MLIPSHTVQICALNSDQTEGRDLAKADVDWKWDLGAHP